MTDLAALRALVEAAEHASEASARGDGCPHVDCNMAKTAWPCLRDALPSATAALARLEESAKSFRDRWCSLCEGPGLIGANGEWYCPLCLIVEQHGKLARLEAVTEHTIARVLQDAHDRARDSHTVDVYAVMARAVLALLRGANGA